MTLIAITGGIGSGKSVVCRILEANGRPVYYCDSRAKAIMDSSPDIRSAIAALISPDAIREDSSIDRKLLADIVFSDAEKLRTLNGIVHGAVREDILRWAEGTGSGQAFVESAIVFESGLDRIVDEIWNVVCDDEDEKIRRICQRDGSTADHARARIAAQAAEREALAKSPIHTRTIHNTATESLLLQVLEEV